jgi:DNA-binding transcriptional regulator GbsR (MarR family)
MTYEERKNKFIQTWGALGSSWGISKTMAQIHALLLISPKSLSTEEIMEELIISRGNVNMNVRNLMDWGLVEKELIIGERKEFFVANKDVEEFSRAIARERMKREIEPVQKVLEDLQNDKANTAGEKELEMVVQDVTKFTNSISSVMNKYIKSDKHWLYKNALKLLK